jgi:TrmH family RNA methyltransferase
MITSTKNPKIKRIRFLQSSKRARYEAGVFIVEGDRLVGEALQAGWDAQSVLYTDGISHLGKAALEELSKRGAPVEQVSPHVMRAASDTQTPQGILVELLIKELPLPSRMDFAFIPDAVRDPGNLGAMLRTAAASGVQAVLLPPGSVDKYSPKVLRGAMGAHFRLPIYSLGWRDINDVVNKSGLHVFLAEAGRGQDYTQAEYRSPVVIIIGGEAHGAGRQAQSMAETIVHIPMPGDTESLNAAVAAGVLLFEVVRQRRSTN